MSMCAPAHLFSCLLILQPLWPEDNSAKSAGRTGPDTGAFVMFADAERGQVAGPIAWLRTELASGLRQKDHSASTVSCPCSSRSYRWRRPFRRLWSLSPNRTWASIAGTQEMPSSGPQRRFDTAVGSSRRFAHCSDRDVISLRQSHCLTKHHMSAHDHMGHWPCLLWFLCCSFEQNPGSKAVVLMQSA